MWKYFQPNEKDKKNKASDCVVRAFCYVSGDSWTTVFKELCEIALKKQLMPNDKRVYEQYLRNHGFEYQGLKIERGHPRPTVIDFTDIETTCYIFDNESATKL